MARKAAKRSADRAPKRSAVRAALAELDTASLVSRTTADRLAVDATGHGLARAAVLRLAATAPLTVPALARSLRQSRQATQRVVDVLEAEGLLQRMQNPSHRLSVLFTPTPTGLRLLGSIDDSSDDLVRYLRKRMSAAEVERLTVLLGRVTELVDGYRAERATTDAARTPAARRHWTE